ncbi:MAG: hypothetical protein HUK20_01445 [Fibrobacter sp.]|nr:hypothetical protein [Fibrobacter sp.]
MKKLLIVLSAAIFFAGCAGFSNQKKMGAYPVTKSNYTINWFDVEAWEPKTLESEEACDEAVFYGRVITKASGYHALIDIQMSETQDAMGKPIKCTYWGLAIKYKPVPRPAKISKDDAYGAEVKADTVTQTPAETQAQESEEVQTPEYVQPVEENVAPATNYQTSF